MLSLKQLFRTRVSRFAGLSFTFILGVIGSSVVQDSWKALWGSLFPAEYAVVVMGPRPEGNRGWEEVWSGIREAERVIREELDHSVDGSLEVRFEAVDDRNDPEYACTAATEHVRRRNVLAVIGHENSSVTLKCLDIYRAAGIPLILPSATHPELTSENRAQEHITVFRLPPNDRLQAQLAAWWVTDRLAGSDEIKIAVLRDDSNWNYSDGLAAEFLKEIRARNNSGGRQPVEGTGRAKIVLDATIGRRGPGLDIANVVYPLMPDVIFFPGGSQAGRALIHQYQALVETEAVANWSPKFIMTDACASAGFYEEFKGSSIAANIFLTAPFEPAPQNRDSDFQQYLNKLQHFTFAPYGYDAAVVVLDAIRAADRKSREAVLRSLNDFKTGNQWRGYHGSFSFNQDGENTAARFHVWQLSQNGPRHMKEDAMAMQGRSGVRVAHSRSR